MESSITVTSSVHKPVKLNRPKRCVPHFLVLLVATLELALIAKSNAQDSPKEGEVNSSQVRSIDELLLFFPSKHPEGDWAPRDLRFQDVWFAAADKTKLHAWYCPAEKPRGTILIAHGNAGNIAMRAEWLQYLQAKLQVSTLMFDYRGYGRSEGVTTVEGALQDARAARTKLSELAGVKESELILMGESVGGAIVVQLAAESPPRALILQSTFSSLRDVADVHYSKLSWLVKANKLDSVAQISKYRGPLLQSHGDRDQIVPFALAQKLFGAANQPKLFVTITGGDHNDCLTEAYLRRLDEFLASLTKTK